MLAIMSPYIGSASSASSVRIATAIRSSISVNPRWTSVAHGHHPQVPSLRVAQQSLGDGVVQPLGSPAVDLTLLWSTV